MRISLSHADNGLWMHVLTKIGSNTRVLYHSGTPILIVVGRRHVARLAATECSAVQMRRIRNFCGSKLPREHTAQEMFAEVNRLMAETIGKHIDHELTKGTMA
jgi:hypothetical protein